MPLILKKSYGERSTYFLFQKVANYTPYLNYTDTLRDLGNALSGREKLMPLIIICDTGSTEESLLSYKRYKLYGIPIIVIDHHVTKLTDGKSEIEDYVDVHINPVLVRGDGSICAGMLAFELSQFITKNRNFLLPAAAGVADKSKGKEFEQYLKLAAGQGYEREYLDRVALAIDFETHYIRGDAKNLVGEFLSFRKEDSERHVTLLAAEAEKRFAETESLIKNHAELKHHGTTLIVLVPLNHMRSKDYPADGKTTSLARDLFQEEHKEKKVVALGYSDDSVTFRVDDSLAGFDLNDIISHLKKELPYGMIEGGGHRVAGTMRFNPDVREKVMAYILHYAASVK